MTSLSTTARPPILTSICEISGISFSFNFEIPEELDKSPDHTSVIVLPNGVTNPIPETTTLLIINYL